MKIDSVTRILLLEEATKYQKKYPKDSDWGNILNHAVRGVNSLYEALDEPRTV